MNKKIFYSIQIALICFLSLNVSAQNIFPEKPNPVTFYNNLSVELPDFLSASEAQSIELKLKAFSDSTSNQIVVLIVDDLLGFEPWEYATEVGEKWGVGGEKEDNGVIVLIKPTGGAGERKTFIATGRGLEAVIPDFTCSEIVNDELIPNFKNGEFYYGINAATDILMSLAIKEFNYEQYSKSKTSNSDEFFDFVPIIFFILIFLVMSYFSKFRGRGGGGGGTYYSSGGFSSSSSSFSSGSSFGGGSFGGGGAGGSW